MKATKSLWILIALALALCMIASSCGGDDDDDNDDEKLYDPVPSDDAYLTAGPTDDGRVILPNGRFLSPVGLRVTLPRFPTSIIMAPEGDRLFVTTARTRALVILDPTTMEVVNITDLPNHFTGLVMNRSGSKLWISGANRETIYEYDIAGDIPVLVRQIHAFGYPGNLALSSDEQTLFACMMYGKRVAAIDLNSGLEIASMNTGTYPYAVALSEVENRIIVSNWGARTVTLFQLDNYEYLADVEVGKNPEGIAIAPEGASAFVVCSDTDDIHVVDLKNLQVNNIIQMYPEEDRGLGALSNDVRISPDGSRLYVTSSGFNSVDVVDLYTQEVVGRIPTEWYPTATLPMEDELYILSAKGVGSGPGNVKDKPEDLDPNRGKLLGSVAKLDYPDEDTLAEYTDMVAVNNSRTARFYEDLNYDSPIPSKRGEKSKEIKHVVFILKENKTFDQVLGDFEGAERDESLLLFGENITPNLHAASRQFTVCDNYYSESHESDMGHLWASAVMSNDYVEKAWVISDWLLLTGVEEAAIPANKFVFHNMLKNDVSFRIYGEVTGTIYDVGTMAPYMDFDYGFYGMAVSDRIKAAEVIREWELGIFPQFVYILLPNDHAAGTTPGEPTMDYFVADNDAGVGMLLDWITHSEHWKETAVFITQDDPQSGTDHIDAHRTPFTVVSPYAKRGHISGVHYSMASMWLTIELILGLPPLTDYDRNTAPMFDLFTTEPDFSTYTAIPSSVPYAENPEDGPMADYSSLQDWSVPDQVERVAEVAWAYMRPGEPFPHHLSIYESDEEEEEEAEEGRRYRELLDAYMEYGKKHNLFTEHSLAGKTMHIKGDAEK